MSRWVDNFKNHAFQSEWIKLKQALELATLDDETITTSVTELARLNKVVSYLDGMIKSIDPELVPLTIWDQFGQQSVNCFNQIVSYNENKDIAHIQNANANTDNLLTYIRPYMVAVKKIDAVFQGAIIKYAQTIDEYGESFREKSTALIEEINDHNDNSKKIYDDIQNTKNLVDQFNVELFGDDETSTNIQNKIEELVREFENKYASINGFYNETLISDGDNSSTKKEISQAKESILMEKENIEELLENINAEVNELKKFHIEMFGKLNPDGTKEGGLSGQLDERIRVLSVFEKKQIIKYDTLNEEIKNLLPSATSAGLASAYFDLKKSFETPIKNASNLFYLSIFIIVLIALSTSIPLGQENDLDTVLKGFLSRIPLYAPILWLALYSTKRRSEYQRLQQEYAHKEALAKSYGSYKKQIDDLDEENIEMQKILIMKAVDAIAYNASDTLDGKHGDKMPVHDFLEKYHSLIKKIVEEIPKLKQN